MSPTPSISTKNTSIRPPAFAFPFNMQKKECAPDGIGSRVTDKMAATSNAAAVGTRGTVASLIMQEIKYFTQLELDGLSSSNKQSSGKLVSLASSCEFVGLNTGSVVNTSTKKKKGNKWNMPMMCSTAEVADRNQLSGLPRFTYRNLKADLKKSAALDHVIR